MHTAPDKPAAPLRPAPESAVAQTLSLLPNLPILARLSSSNLYPTADPNTIAHPDPNLVPPIEPSGAPVHAPPQPFRRQAKQESCPKGMIPCAPKG